MVMSVAGVTVLLKYLSARQVPNLPKSLTRAFPMKISSLIAAVGLAAATIVTADVAVAQGYPWRNHDRNYAFLFGNDIDTHQQTRLMSSGELYGFFYVRYTGSVTADGYPVAAHADCNTVNDCRVAWILRGVPGMAAFLYHAENDHPTWLVARADIPQPGAYSHFHHLGDDPTAPGQVRDGYFLELQAIDRFCFVHHEAGSVPGNCADIGGVPVSAGLDIATHVNIVGSSPPN